MPVVYNHGSVPNVLPQVVFAVLVVEESQPRPCLIVWKLPRRSSQVVTVDVLVEVAYQVAETAQSVVEIARSVGEACFDCLQFDAILTAAWGRCLSNTSVGDICRDYTVSIGSRSR